MADQNYPLLYAEVGSVIKNGKIQLAGILSDNGSIKKFKPGEKGSTFMSGSSKYVHSDQMNQGSIGLSVKGGLMAGAMSAYYGQSSATSGKKVSVNYNAIISAGIESLAINELSITDFINSMAVNPKRQMLKILNNYNDLVEKKQAAKVEGIRDIYDKKNPKIEELKKAFTKWNDSVETFFDFYGEAVVVSVHWGAFGFVNMEFSNNSHATEENYGVEGEFNYGGSTIGVSVKAAYLGNKSSANADSKAQVISEYTGNSIKSLIHNWRQVVDGKSFQELADVNVLNKAPALEVPKDMKPSYYPKYKKPSLTDKITKIKSEEDWKLFDDIQRYEKEKERNEGLTIDEFLKPKLYEEEDEEGEREVAGAMDDIVGAIEGEKPLLSEPAEDDSQDKRKKVSKHSVKKTKDNITSKVSTNNDISTERNNLSENFVPLGVMACNWPDLFPWLSIAQDTILGDITESKQIIKWRAMIQDFIGLSNLYYTAARTELKFPEGGTPIQIANSFASMCEILQGKRKEDLYSDIMNKAFNGLSNSAQAIYRVWDEVGLLRKAELGLGCIDKIKGGSISSTLRVAIRYFKGKHIRIIVGRKPCGYNEANKNYDVFSEFHKLLPIILPDGSIRAFNKFGYLGSFASVGIDKGVGKKRSLEEFNMNDDAFFTKITDSGHVYERMHFDILYPKRKIEADFAFWAYSFIVDKESKCLRNIAVYNKEFVLYPIPFSAAKGIQWKGVGSGITSLSSFKDVKDNIKELKVLLKNSKLWSSTNESLAKITWDPDTGLSDIPVEEHYMGIVPEQADLMKLFK